MYTSLYDHKKLMLTSLSDICLRTFPTVKHQCGFTLSTMLDYLPTQILFTITWSKYFSKNTTLTTTSHFLIYPLFRLYNVVKEAVIDHGDCIEVIDRYSLIHDKESMALRRFKCRIGCKRRSQVNIPINNKFSFYK